MAASLGLFLRAMGLVALGVIASAALPFPDAKPGWHQVVSAEFMQPGPANPASVSVHRNALRLRCGVPPTLPLVAALPARARPVQFESASYNAVVGKQVTSRAVSFGGVDCTNRFAPQDVFSWSGGSAVVGVAASTGSVVAHKVVKLVSRRNRSHLSEISDAVDEPTGMVTTSQSITSDCSGSLPNVATLLVLYPSRRVLTGGPGNKHADHLARRFRYFRMYFALYTRRHLEHRPSEARFPASLWPRLQYMAFMPSKVTHSGVTDNGA